MKASSDTSSTSANRILLIDDNCHGLLARKVVLEQCGYAVTACSSPEEALEVFGRHEFDLVVTDYRMPSMNGTELIKVVRESRPGIPVILISGMVKVLGLNEQNTGADEVIAKDGDEVNRITRAVERLLRRFYAKKPVSTRGAAGNRGKRRA